MAKQVYRVRFGGFYEARADGSMSEKRLTKDNPAVLAAKRAGTIIDVEPIRSQAADTQEAVEELKTETKTDHTEVMEALTVLRSDLEKATQTLIPFVEKFDKYDPVKLEAYLVKFDPYIAESREFLNGLRGKIDGIESHVVALDSFETLYASLKTSIEDKLERISEEQTRQFAESRATVERLTTEVLELKNTMQKSGVEFTALRDHLNELETRLSSVVTQKGLEDEIQKLTTHLDDVHRLIAESLDQHATVHAESRRTMEEPMTDTPEPAPEIVVEPGDVRHVNPAWRQRFVLWMRAPIRWGKSFFHWTGAWWTARKARLATAAATAPAPTPARTWSVGRVAKFAAAFVIFAAAIWLIVNRGPVSNDQPLQATNQPDQQLAQAPAVKPTPTPLASVPAVPTTSEDSPAVKSLAVREAQLETDIGQMKNDLGKQLNVLSKQVIDAFDQRFALLKTQIDGVVKSQKEAVDNIALVDKRVATLEMKSATDIANLRRDMDAKIEAAKNAQPAVLPPPVASAPATISSPLSPGTPEVSIENWGQLTPVQRWKVYLDKCPKGNWTPGVDVAMVQSALKDMTPEEATPIVNSCNVAAIEAKARVFAKVPDSEAKPALLSEERQRVLDQLVKQVLR